MLEALEDFEPMLVISTLAVGFAVLLAVLAYLLPGVRVVRSIAGVICILAAIVIVVVSFDAGPSFQTPTLAAMILLSALIIAVRPERKPKEQPVRPYPPASPPYPSQPQESLQSPPVVPQRAQHGPAQHTPAQHTAPQPGYQQPGGQQVSTDRPLAGD